VQLSAPADNIEVLVYTKAMVKIGGFSASKTVAATALERGWNSIQVPAGIRAQMQRGLFFWVVSAQRSGAGKGKTGLVKVMIL